MKTCTLLVTLSLLTISPSIAQQPTPASPEMQRLLSAMSGTWIYHFKFEPTEKTPNGGTAEGKAVFRAGPGGLSMIEDETAKEADGETSGLSVTWWDAKAHGYRAIWCDNKMPSGCIVMSRLANWEGNDFVLGDEFTRDGKKFIFREVVSDIMPNSYTQTLSQGEAGKELKTILTIHATRSHTPADSNKALFRHAVDVWAAGDMSALEQVVAPGYIGHTSTGDRDIQGLRQRIEAFHKLYSNISFHIEDQMADGDKVVTHLTADVTMRESGKSARLMAINISALRTAKSWKNGTLGSRLQQGNARMRHTERLTKRCKRAAADY